MDGLGGRVSAQPRHKAQYKAQQNTLARVKSMPFLTRLQMNLRHSRIDAALHAELRVLAYQHVTRCVKDSAAGKHPVVKPCATSLRENTICSNESRSNRVSTSCLKFLNVAQFTHARKKRHASIHRANYVIADECADDCHALNY